MSSRYLPPLAAMTNAEIEACLDRAEWLLEREKLLPREL